MSLKVYFDGTLIDEQYYTGLINNNEMFNGSFMLGATPCNTYVLRIAKEGVSSQPSIIELKEDTITFANLKIDNIEEQDYEYVYTLTDRMIDLNFNYDASEVFVNDSATLLQIVQDICSKVGLTLGTNNFRGYNKSISWYDNTRTARDYIGYVAELNGGFARIENNTLYFRKQNTLSVKTISIDDCEDFNIGEYHKITRVVYEMGALKYEYGDSTGNTLYLNADNVYITEQSEVQAIYNDIKNFEYYSFNTTNCPIDYDIKAGDIITFTDGTNNYTTIVQYDLEYYGGWIGGYNLDVNTERQQETQIIGTSKQIKNLKVIVDRDANRITQLAEATPEITTTQAGYGSLNFTNVNEGQPIYIRVYPRNPDIEALHPTNILYPEIDRYIFDRIIRFSNTTTNEIVDYEIPDDLYYYDDTHYDEFILDYDNKICKIIKRVGRNPDTLMPYLLDDEVETNYPYPLIELENGNYTISVLDVSTAYIKVKLMIQNGFTEQFATKLELNSKIEQTENEINLSVNQKLNNYSTTEEMNGAINVTAGEISSVVSKKVGENEIISKINQSAETVSINANKINLNGVVTANNNFKIKTDGSMEALNANISGTISGGNISVRANFTSNNPYIEVLDPNSTNVKPKFTSIWTNGISAVDSSDNPSAVIRTEVEDGFAELNGSVVNAFGFNNVSLEEMKKNFEKLENGLEIIKKTDIYKYNYKNEKDTDKKHIGFVIGKNYNYSKELTSKKNDGADTYSMVSVCFKAIQEQQEQIEELQREINKLKGDK